MIQIDKELDELQTLSNFATYLSSYVCINIIGMNKILKKFDKKFKRYNLNFKKNFIIEKYNKKNSDLLYINQYKILDEVGACIEQLYFELKDQYYYLIKYPIKEENNMRSNSLNKEINKELNSNDDHSLFNDNNKEEILINNKEDNNIDLSIDTNKAIKNKFHILKESIHNMEDFYHEVSTIFNYWKRYLKKNDYKSHIYSVKSAGEIEDNSDSESTKDIEKNKSFKKVQHYLSRESYWNIRIILTQALIMSISSSYILPTIYYILKHDSFLDNFFKNNIRRGFLCGLVISMSPFGGLISMLFSNFIIKKTYKFPILLSSVLSIIGNLLFIFGIAYTSIFLICISRLITGFSLNTPVHRNYLLYFIPKRRMNKYLLYFKLFVLLGNSLGPLLSFFSLFIDIFEKNNIFERKSYLNEYTLPGWICTSASIILLFVIIIIFSEPLSSKFIIYAEGQSPTDIMRISGCFSLDNNLTRYEAEKLNEINQKISIFNDENQYNDTNLVSLTIKELIEMEIEPCGTVRKAFWIILFYEFILNFTQFCYITMAPAYLYINLYIDKNSSFEKKIISFLYFFSLFLMIPTFCFNFFYLSMRLNQILYIKVVSLIFLFLQLLTISIVIQSNSLPYIFYSIFLLTILLAYIVEDQLLYFYTHIIPTNFKLGIVEGLTFIHIAKYLGYIIGSASSLFEFLLKEAPNEEQNIEKFMIIQNSFALLIQFFLLIIFFYYSELFSDRPIRRIINSKNKREIAITEF